MRAGLSLFAAALALALPCAAANISESLARFAAVRNAGLPALAVDLSQASLVVPTDLSGPENKAAQMLEEEVEARALVRWDRRSDLPASGPAVVLGTFAQVRSLLGPSAFLREQETRAEGYQIATLASGNSTMVVVAGHDVRGVLFGVGRLIRALRLGPARAGLSEPLSLVSSPRYALRGHQLGYRPKPNAYSGWDLPQWESYIRSLVLFGCNTVEFLPPRTDDIADSPHFPRPQLDMLRGMSRLADAYGLDVWLWYPAMDENYADPATVASALREWDQVFRAVPRLDAVLVPGGDPGHTGPRVLMPFLEKQAANLRRSHPRASLWVSPQGFDPADMAYFFTYLRERQPAWLAGVTYAPWINLDLPEFRRRVPARYPIRYYPDITHTADCQYPVANWDPAFALTEGREPICPRPLAMARILRLLQPNTIGAVTYSEGVNDDVNKAVWSALSWDPDADVAEILRQYGRVFLSERLGDDFAAGLLALEENWRGPLAENSAVERTLARFRDLEQRATPADLHRWRFQAALYRAYFDASVQARLRRERAEEARTLGILGRAATLGSAAAMEQASDALAGAGPSAAENALRLRIYQLAEALFQSVNYKLSVPLYRAEARPRGANLDSLDYPLNDRLWLEAEFARIRDLDTEGARRSALERLARWTDPGPGGFYDDLGDPAAEPHLEKGRGAENDPAFLHTPLNGYFPIGGEPPAWRFSWQDFVLTLGGAELSLSYSGLDPDAAYEVRVVYPHLSSSPARIRLRANGILEVHSYLAAPDPVAPMSFDLPRAATRDGHLRLTWSREPGVSGPGASGNGRGCQVAEVWLLRKSPP